MARSLQSFPGFPRAAANSKDTAVALAAAYRCPGCDGHAEVTDVVSTKHGLFCQVAARIARMRREAAA
jgi:hypothetical protein